MLQIQVAFIQSQMAAIFILIITLNEYSLIRIRLLLLYFNFKMILMNEIFRILLNGDFETDTLSPG